METRSRSSSTSGKRYLVKAALLSMVGGAVLAAALFVANSQPWGYIAPPALSGSNFKRGNVVAYTPWFEQNSFRGDLLALPVAANGSVTLLTPDWRAATVLDLQDFSTGRRIVTTDGAGTAIPFRFSGLTPVQQAQVGSKAVLDYVRGERTNESAAGMRVRGSVLGDIIHSGPVYIGRPKAGYVYGDYLAFANANATRPGRLYVGANDGMLHAFDASNGSEVFAYVPSMVMGNLQKLTVQPYKHQYFVDGFLTVEDAQIGNVWHSVLAGGLGAGGKGYFALDVTDASAGSEVAAASKILWEFHNGSPGATNLGYSYSRPSIVRLDNAGSWGVVVGNGYLSTNGEASLFVLDVQTGAVLSEIIVPGGAGNGLSSPTVVDSDGDGIVDIAYAGDLNGNLWKFNLGPSGPASWGVAFGGQPLFQTAAGQPITTAPEVGLHPNGGFMVYIGTGRLFSASDGTDKTTQAVYGLWDDGTPVSVAPLLQQQLRSTMHLNGAATRVATDNKPDWSVHRGWVMPTQIAAATLLDQGERVIQDILLRDGRVSFMSTNPTIGTGDNWFIQVDAFTGGAPSKTIIDVNEDLLLNVADNVDGNSNGVIEDVREDRVVGQYQNFGLASRPVIGVLGTASDAALINHLTAIPPNLVFDPNDPGLIGGHFDLDTSTAIYPFSSGSTDGHVHQWDDKHNLTTVNLMSLPDGGGNPLSEINDPVLGVNPNSPFMLTIANDQLSPGGVLEINSSSINVVDYRGLVNRYLTGTLLLGEKFPFYKLNPPTAAEAAAGVTQLISLKLSFDAFAIVSGDLIPTETGCVRGNDPGALGEYRNGALLLQALDASDVSAGFSASAITGSYEAGSTAVDATLGYATRGLFWESTVFWHWKGGCYGQPGWAQTYLDCVTNGGGQCLATTSDKKDKGKKKKKKKKDDDDDDDDDDDPSTPPPPPPPGGGQPVGGADPGHNVTNTTIGGSNDTGRLFWKEVVPEE